MQTAWGMLSEEVNNQKGINLIFTLSSTRASLIIVSYVQDVLRVELRNQEVDTPKSKFEEANSATSTDARE
jgi:hypothetical protein